jgi:tape measure domain-containing protein
MSSVDDRIVNMRFNNSTFERGASATLNTLDKLKKSLDFSSSTKKMNDLQSAAGKFSLSNMEGGVTNVSKKFLALATIGITALSNITNKAVDAGIRMAKSLTIDPIMAGFHEYETQLGSIQTILANTGLEGESGLAKVNTALNELNTYSDKTIYNFTEMARNIGTFTAAGVKLGPATSAIKGIANLAALSGSNTEQASTAMYQLSQAIANNKVGLQDWNSVVNAGMGGKVFQEALWNTAKQLGTIKDIPVGMSFDDWTKSGNSFRESLKDGWITGKVLTQTLSTFTGDLTDAQLKSMGYTDKQIAAIQKQAKTASDAATKVKTFTQLMDTLREAVGSGWAQTFQILFGNFNEAKDLWTGISNVVGGAIAESSNARNKLLKDWKALGGRTVLIDAIGSAFKDLFAILRPIKDAFRDIFPATTGKQLYDLTVRFKNFMDSLRIGSDTAEDLKRTFRGVFAIFDIIGQVISGVIHMFGSLFSTISGGSLGILHFTGNIGDFLVSIDQALKKGTGLRDFFGGLGKVLAIPLNVLKALGQLIGGLFDGFDQGDANSVSSAFQKIGDTISNLLSSLGPFGQQVINFFSSLGHAIADAMSGANLDSILDIFQTVFLGGIALAIRKFLSSGLKFEFGGGVLESLSGAFGELSGTLKAMQTQLKATALLEIAGAVALLAGSLVALSLIKPDKMENAVKGLTMVFVELLGAMKLLTGMTAGGAFVKVPIIASGMVVLSGAVLTLTLAVKSLAKLQWEDLKKGLTGVGIALGLLVGTAVILSKYGSSMLSSGAALIAFAASLKIIASVVKDFSGMDWRDLLKGLTGVAGALVAVAVGMRLMPTGMIATGAGLVAVAFALKLIVGAVQSFSEFNWKQLGKGLAGIAGSLVVIAGAMRLMPKGMIAQAAALMLVSLALQNIGKAIAKMGGLSWKEIGKGLATLAGSLTVLAVALRFIKGNITGAIALGIISASLAVLAGVLETIGKLSWSEIIKGLVGIAGALLILGVTGAALSGLAPAIAAVGAALILLGGAVALAGAGVYLIAKGLGYLSEHGSKGIAILLKALDEIIERVPEMAKALATGLVELVTIIGQNTPKMVDALTKVIVGLMQVVINSLPKALELFTKLIATFLVAIEQNVPKIVDAALDLLIDFLEAVASKMPDIMKAGANLIVKFLEGIGNNAQKIIDAGFDTIIKFLDGLAVSIKEHTPELMEKGVKLIAAVIQGIAQGLLNIAGWIWDQVKNFFVNLWNKVLGWFGAGSPATKGIQLGISIIQGLWNGISGLASWIWSKVAGFFSSLWSKITSWGWVGKMLGLGASIVKNLWNGISGLVGWAVGKVAGFVTSVWNEISKLPGKILGLAGQMLNAGKSIIGSLFNGFIAAVKSAGNFVGDIASQIVNGIINMINNALGLPWVIKLHIHGPGPLPDLNFGPYTILPRIPNFALGGWVKKTGLAVVGEEGPEIVQLPAGSRVFPSGTEPVITPVLDLTEIRKSAEEIDRILSVNPKIIVSVSLENASTISATGKPIPETPVNTVPSVSEVKFEQNNYSPKALSPIEIYRQTRNQLAMAKEVLSKP